MLLITQALTVHRYFFDIYVGLVPFFVARENRDERRKSASYVNSKNGYTITNNVYYGERVRRTMKDKIFGILQRVGRSFMLPIAILPVAGLLLGIGGSFTNETMLETYGLLGVMGPGTVLNQILQVMNAAGNIIFTNLPIIFAMGVAIGMAKKEKEVAALAAVIAVFYHACLYRSTDQHQRRR